MSWQLFKNNMIAFSSNPNGIASIDAVAEKYAIEYDACIKRGSIKYLNSIPLSKAPNLEVMKSFFKIALQTGLSTKTPYELVTQMGKGVIGYWTGASLQNLAPSIPAVGSVVNIAGNANYISDVGQWNPTPPTLPTKEYALIIDSFILAAQFHLTTLKGVINTTSLSIALGSPVPGLITWTGYTIDPSDRSTGSNLAKKIEDAEAEMTEEEKALLQNEIDIRNQIIDVTELLENATQKAFNEMIDKEQETFNKTSVSINLTLLEQKEIDIACPEESKCTIGTSIVRTARKDIGLIETGASEKALYPGGTNMGGQQDPNVNKFNELPTPKDRSGRYTYKPGRIDEMIDAVFGAGTNKGYFVGTGLGLDWCGCAVASWWTSANQKLPPNKGAAWVPAWKTWAVTNKLWIPVEARPPFPNSIKKPKIGAALIYTKKAGAVPYVVEQDGKSTAYHYHIGIVSGIIELANGKWTITTIEGNSGGPKGYQGRGLCCDEKVPTSTVAGFVNPPGCQ
jgi:hypothetical protein